MFSKCDLLDCVDYVFVFCIYCSLFLLIECVGEEFGLVVCGGLLLFIVEKFFKLFYLEEGEVVIRFL